MSFINKLTGGMSSSKIQEAAQTVAEKTPVFRFGGWQTMGAHTRPADTRTTEQLMANIDYFASRNPEVAQFKKELKSMKPEHLGLVSDICELGTNMEMINTNIDIRKPASNGKSLLQFLLEKLPKASKENPEALNFTQEVINQTDTTASKYFMGCFAGIFEHPEAGKHLAATKPLVKDIAQVTLSGGYTMDYSKERKFVNALSAYVNPSVNPEKIEVVNETLRAADKVPESLLCNINGTDIINSTTSVKQMRENLETFSQIKEGLSQKTKEVNLSEFITRNVNLD